MDAPLSAQPSPSLELDEMEAARLVRLQAMREDLDIVPDPSPENLDRLANVLTSLDALLTLRPTQAVGSDERTVLRRGRNLNVTTRLGDLDVVQRLPGVPSYAALVQSAETTTLDAVPLRVCSRAALIAMKQARASAQDVADIERLQAGTNPITR